ncbi:MAG: acyltransferase, partial [Mycobacterium sp.]|nr:acyltransferase [Mycobacterium sp.]
MTLLRRAVTVPLATVVMLGILAVWPVLLVIGGVAGLMARSSLPIRTLGVVMAYALLELRALWTLLRGGQDCDEFMRDLLERAYTAVRRTLHVEVRLDTGSPS